MILKAQITVLAQQYPQYFNIVLQVVGSLLPSKDLNEILNVVNQVLPIVTSIINLFGKRSLSLPNTWQVSSF